MAIAALLAVTTAHARVPIHHMPIGTDTSLERYVHDLIGQDPSDRLFAARVLHRRVREAWRLSSRESADINVIEAKQTLSDFDTMVAPKCIRQLKVTNTMRPCASILGMLETQDAVQPLLEQRDQERSRRNIRAINRALERIQANP
jgi:hypothetical protein